MGPEISRYTLQPSTPYHRLHRRLQHPKDQDVVWLVFAGIETKLLCNSGNLRHSKSLDFGHQPPLQNINELTLKR